MSKTRRSNPESSIDNYSEIKNDKKSSPDPFFSENNMKFLRHGISELNAGKGTEHELIDENEEKI